jgi:hypothetical protein
VCARILIEPTWKNHLNPGNSIIADELADGFLGFSMHSKINRCKLNRRIYSQFRKKNKTDALRYSQTEATVKILST